MYIKLSNKKCKGGLLTMMKGDFKLMEEQKLQMEDCEVLLKRSCSELKKLKKLRDDFNTRCECVADIKFVYQTNFKLIEFAIKEVEQNDKVLTNDQRDLLNKVKEVANALRNAKYGCNIEGTDIQTPFERFCVHFKETNGVDLLQGYYSFLETQMKDKFLSIEKDRKE